mmetsp:Transcript_54857/g.130794  ORF Transcript_54857/g.130794 Transcript_54857/m.130794 type:complete len:249 (+) Transcript_54857:310-1056(+)
MVFGGFNCSNAARLLHLCCRYDPPALSVQGSPEQPVDCVAVSVRHLLGSGRSFRDAGARLCRHSSWTCRLPRSCLNSCLAIPDSDADGRCQIRLGLCLLVLSIPAWQTMVLGFAPCQGLAHRLMSCCARHPPGDGTFAGNLVGRFWSWLSDKALASRSGKPLGRLPQCLLADARRLRVLFHRRFGQRFGHSFVDVIHTSVCRFGYDFVGNHIWAVAKIFSASSTICLFPVPPQGGERGVCTTAEDASL